VFFEPIVIEGKHWTDGGVVCITPIEEAIRLGATDIDVIMCNNPSYNEPWTGYKHRALPDVMLRVIDLMSTEVGRDDLLSVGVGSTIVRLIDKYKNVRIRLVEPRSSLPFSSLEFEPDSIRTMINIGYNDANSCLLF
jgi:predicted patatin/cPLA2 family phospholipase